MGGDRSGRIKANVHEFQVRTIRVVVFSAHVHLIGHRKRVGEIVDLGGYWLDHEVAKKAKKKKKRFLSSCSHLTLSHKPFLCYQISL